MEPARGHKTELMDSNVERVEPVNGVEARPRISSEDRRDPKRSAATNVCGSLEHG